MGNFGYARKPPGTDFGGVKIFPAFRFLLFVQSLLTSAATNQIPIGCHAVLNSTVSRIQYGFSTFALNQSVAACFA